MSEQIERSQLSVSTLIDATEIIQGYLRANENIFHAATVTSHVGNTGLIEYYISPMFLSCRNENELNAFSEQVVNNCPITTDLERALWMYPAKLKYTEAVRNLQHSINIYPAIEMAQKIGEYKSGEQYGVIKRNEQYDNWGFHMRMYSDLGRYKKGTYFFFPGSRPKYLFEG